MQENPSRTHDKEKNIAFCYFIKIIQGAHCAPYMRVLRGIIPLQQSRLRRSRDQPGCKSRICTGAAETCA